MPDENRRAMRRSLREATHAYRQMAQATAGRVALENVCKRRLDSTREATASMGCEW